MERIGIETTQNVNINYRIANVGERIGATLIDGVIQAAYWIIFALVISEYVSYRDRETAFFIAMLPYMFYHLLMEIFLNGQSLGKKALKIRVVRSDGAQPTIGNYIVRWLFRIVDVAMFSGIVAVVVIAANGKGQRLGDIVAKTTVINLKRKENIKETLYEEVPESHQMRYPEAYMLTEDDIRTIKEVLAHYKSNISSSKAVDYVRRTALAVEKKSGIKNDTTPGEFLDAIVKDYNYYYSHIAK